MLHVQTEDRLREHREDDGDMTSPRITDHDQIVVDAAQCAACRLRLQRQNVVIYRGNPSAPMVIIGEGPGQVEDARGQPFVGPAGHLLDRILERAEVPADQLYITNVVKCRPPQNRDPLPDEVRSCRTHLIRQLQHVNPKVIVTAGKIATRSVTGTFGAMNVLLGEDLVCLHTGVPVIPIYHPAYLLRRLNDTDAREVLADTVQRLQQAWRLAKP